MKSFKAIAITALAAIVFVSCAKVEKILPKKDGIWNVTELSMKVLLDGVTFIDTVMTTDLGTVTFTDDGKAVATQDTNTTDFTWSADGDNITFTMDDGNGGTDTQVWTVVESKSKTQEWSYVDESTDSVGTTTVTTRTELNQKLERAD